MIECTDPSLGQLLHAYEIDSLDEADLERYEIHLLQCDHCADEVRSFRASAELLRSDRSVQELAEGFSSEGDAENRSVGPMRPRTRMPRWLALSFSGGAVALLLTLAVLLQREEPSSGPSPALVVQLVPDRAARAPSIPSTARRPVVVLFVFRDAVPGDPYRVTLRAADGQLVYDDPDYRAFDAYETGSLLLPDSSLDDGMYTLTIHDPNGDPKISAQEYRFRIGQ